MGALTDLAGSHVEETYQPRSMYLDTVQPSDDKRLIPPPSKRADDPYWFGSLTTKGIDGAQSQSFSTLINRGDEAKEHLSKIWSTERYMFPTQLHPKETVRPELALNTSDIPGANPSPDPFRSHARGTDPLHPKYRLPGHSLDWVPQEVPDRFVRDSINVGDIEGACSKRCVRNRAGFTTLGAEDIEGAAPGYKPFFRRHMGTAAGQRDTISCADINTKSGPRIAPRAAYPDGDVEGSKPRPLGNGRGEGEYMDMSLKVADISGAVPWRQQGNLNDPFTKKFERRQFRATNNTADISGASPSSYVSRLPISQHAAKVAQSEQQREQETSAIAVTSAISTDAATVRALKAKFGECETDGSGMVSGEEFVDAVRCSGLAVGGEEMRQLHEGLTDGGTGLVDYRPFVGALTAKTTARPSASRPHSASSSRQLSRQSSRSATRPQTARSSSSRTNSSIRGCSRPPSGRSTSYAYRSSRPASAPGQAAAVGGPPVSHPTTGTQTEPQPQAESTSELPVAPSKGASDRAPTPPDTPPQQAWASPRPSSAGPHHASIAEVVATAGKNAEYRAKLAAAVKTVSYKQEHTSEVGKPKYWFGRMGHTADSVAINQKWRAGSDRTMLGLQQHMATAAMESSRDNKDVNWQAGKQGTARPSRPQSAVSARASTRPAYRPKSAMPASATGFTTATSTGIVNRRPIMKAPTPLYRPTPTAERYASGRTREGEFDRADIAAVRNLM